MGVENGDKREFLKNVLYGLMTTTWSMNWWGEEYDLNSAPEIQNEKKKKERKGNIGRHYVTLK